MLDSFSGNTQTGWTDTPNGGHFTQGGGQLAITTAAGAHELTYGAKTSSSFANAASETLEFRVNVNTMSDPTNPVAILAWLPSGAAPGSGSSGYSLSVSSGLITLQKGSSVLYSTNYTTAGTNVQSTNTTMVLRMTPSGGTMTVNARVYQQTSNQPDEDFTEVFEYTATAADTVGTPGYAVLGVNSGGSATGAAVQFANLQVFVLTDTVLDDFSGGSADLTNWDLTLNHGTATIANNTFELTTLTYNNTIFTGARRILPNYEITDGSRLELNVDALKNPTGANGDAYAIAVLGFTPFNSDAGVNNLIAYHVGAGTEALYCGKVYTEWWVNASVYPEVTATGIPAPTENPGNNMRLIITMTGEGTSCRIDSRVEDLNVGVNDPNRLIFQNVFVDTAGVDPLDNAHSPHNPDGTGLPFGPAPYLNLPGSILLYSFFGGNSTDYSDITFGNLVVNQTAPLSLPPTISGISPPDGSNFVANTTPVSFTVLDSVNTPANNISLTLNGVTYVNGVGAVVSGGNQTRLFTLTNTLAPDTFYQGTLVATNSVGLVTSQGYSIDTFTTNDCFTVESEDWNFGGGEFYEANCPTPPCGPYNNVVNGYYLIFPQGVEGTDFHDSRSGANVGDEIYRQEAPRNDTTSDGPRAKYASNPYPGEVVVTDRQAGDWMNYTHVYPEGYFTAYMRMAQYVLPQSLITLEQVTSDPTQPNQTTEVLGSFLGLQTGYDVNRNVPLTDAFGNPLVLYFSGGTNTLRINNQIVNANETDLFQNYFVFAPAATPGSLPPFVAYVTPLAGSTINVGAPNPSATIVNRTTTLNTGSVILQVNGATISATTTPTNNGAVVTWTATGSTPTITNTLIFEDSASVWQTNSWTYTYGVVLNAANSLPVGSLTVPGFDARMVQSSAANIGGNGGLPNGVSSADAILSIPPAYPIDQSATNWVQAVAYDIGNPPGNGAITNFPGLCIPPGNVNSFAIEIFAYLQLAAGPNRIYVDSDDDVGLYSGTNLTDTSTILIDTSSIGVEHGSFDFLVPAAGLYPFHVVYEQGGGAAYLVLHSVNLSTGTETLLNLSGGDAAYYPLIFRSASSLAGPFNADPAANAGNVMTTAPIDCDMSGVPLNVAVNGGTATFPMPTQTTFYLLDGPRPSTITSFKVSGGNLVIKYQYQ